jgi:uncharacterized protein (TIGR00369 family)
MPTIRAQFPHISMSGVIDPGAKAAIEADVPSDFAAGFALVAGTSLGAIFAVTLAESVASLAANLTLDRSLYRAVGQEINANHIRPVKTGLVTATAKPLHLGVTSQVWHIEIVNEQGKLTCVSRMTGAVIKRHY